MAGLAGNCQELLPVLLCIHIHHNTQFYLEYMHTLLTILVRLVYTAQYLPIDKLDFVLQTIQMRLYNYKLILMDPWNTLKVFEILQISDPQ